jgi:drug/metabolite transporter (DMT)-like permease
MRLRKEVLALVAATACWGSAVVTIKVASRGLTSWAVTAIELTTTLVILTGVVIIGRIRLSKPSWGLAFAGFLEPTLAYILINSGLARTSGTHASLVIGLQSLLVVIMAAVFHKHIPSRRVMLGLAIALAGLIAVTTTRGSGTPTFAGDALIFLGVLCAAAYILVAHGISEKYHSVELTFYQFFFGSLALVPFITFSVYNTHQSIIAGATPLEIGAAVTTGIFGSALGFLLYNRALQDVSPTMAGASLTLIPVFGVIFSALLLGESLTLAIILGGLLVVTGVAISTS